MSVIYNLIHNTFQQWNSGKCHTDFKRGIWFSCYWLSRSSIVYLCGCLVGVSFTLKPLSCVLGFGLYFKEIIICNSKSFLDLPKIYFKCFTLEEFVFVFHCQICDILMYNVTIYETYMVKGFIRKTSLVFTNATLTLPQCREKTICTLR